MRHDIIASCNPFIEDGPAQSARLRLITAWVEIAIPELHLEYMNFYQDYDGVNMESEPMLWPGPISMAEKMAEILDDAVKWEALEQAFIDARREGNILGYWKLEKEFEPEELEPEDFEKALQWVDEGLDPEDLSVDAWRSLEFFMKCKISKADFQRIILERERRDNEPQPPALKPYQILVYENTGSGQGEPTLLPESFEDGEEATQFCRRLVFEHLIECDFDFQRYASGGIDPTVMTPPGRETVEFSAWDFAKEICEHHQRSKETQTGTLFSEEGS